MKQHECPGCGEVWKIEGGEVSWFKCACGASYDPRERPDATPERMTVGDYAKTDECLRIQLTALGFGTASQPPADIPPGELWAICGGKVVGKVTGIAETPEPGDNPLLCEILGFLNDLTHPEQYGHAVTAEVRRRARELAEAIETSEGMR